jgi:hypothetical protein
MFLNVTTWRAAAGDVRRIEMLPKPVLRQAPPPVIRNALREDLASRWQWIPKLESGSQNPLGREALRLDRGLFPADRQLKRRAPEHDVLGFSMLSVRLGH